MSAHGHGVRLRWTTIMLRQVATRGFSSDRTVVLFIGLGAVVGGAVIAVYALAPD